MPHIPTLLSMSLRLPSPEENAPPSYSALDVAPPSYYVSDVAPPSFSALNVTLSSYPRGTLLL